MSANVWAKFNWTNHDTDIFESSRATELHRALRLDSSELVHHVHGLIRLGQV